MPSDDSESRRRELAQLRSGLGQVVLSALDEPATVEVLLNADGRLWHERLGENMQEAGKMLPGQAEAFLRCLASILRTTITRENPILDGELPDGSRVSGQIPPIVASPVFAIRKRASAIFPLSQYVEDGIMTEREKQTLCEAVRGHRNMIVSGSVGSGKTTLLNALIQEIDPAERLLVIEDTTEIQCASLNSLHYRASFEVSMTRLVRTSLRMRPDRVLVGEVRGEEALDLLIALNLGHPGGMATIHANDARSSLTRLETLISMNPRAPRDIPKLIGEVQPVLVHINKTKKGRVLREILEVQEYMGGAYQLRSL
jgi:type IV secretion system protein VirB11